jgi:hypothetical protein
MINKNKNYFYLYKTIFLRYIYIIIVFNGDLLKIIHCNLKIFLSKMDNYKIRFNRFVQGIKIPFYSIF